MRFRNRKEKDTIVVDDRTKDIENADDGVDSNDESTGPDQSLEDRVTILEERLDAIETPVNGAADLNDNTPEATFRGGTGHNE